MKYYSSPLRAGLDKKLGSRKSLGSRIADRGSRIAALGSRIADRGSRIAFRDRGPRVENSDTEGFFLNTHYVRETVLFGI